MRVFLTGAGGYLGSILAEHLARMPEVEAVVGIGLSRPKRPLPEKVKFTQMDIRAPEMRQAMAGCDAVVHTACIVLWPASMSAQERDDINLNGVRHMAEAAIANKVRRFVHASSMAVYDPALACGKSDINEDFPLGKGDSSYYYWNGKALAEQTLTRMLGSANILLTMFRPIYIIGPRNHCVIESYRQNAINFPRLNPRRQFIHEEDVAAAFVHALRTEMPGPYNVTPDDFIRLSDLWSAVGAKSVRTVPLRLARMVTWLRWRWMGSPVHPSWVSDMLVDFTGSNGRLKNAGWKPQFGSAEALRSAL
jgi:nucleoside-diphosphate-sugar epimerase